MEQLLKPKTNILKLIRQAEPVKGTELKLSQYAVRIDVSGKKLLFHTITKECLLLNDAYSVPDTFVYGEKEVDNSLITNRFYVPVHSDECAFYCGLLTIFRNIDTYKGIKTYTILPTTFCNARCFYCYELNYHFVSMNKETIDQVIEFIKRTHAGEEIHLNWFGGEPLLGQNTITQIAKALSEAGIRFRSGMVTNGSLFNEALIMTAKTIWNLKKVQITLDGDEAEYNRRKNYFDSSVSPFSKVIHNIRSLSEAGIKVSIRLNVDYENIESLKLLAVKLDEEIKDKTNISIYANPLYSMMESCKCVDIWKQALEIEKEFKAHGFRTPDKRGLSGFKTYFCMADNPANAVINADGSVYGCEHCPAGNRLCSLDETPVKGTKKTVSVSDVREKCKDCAFLPECTEFKDCPDIVYDCKAVYELKLKDTLQGILDQDSSSAPMERSF